jgi:hypothetical protein
MTLRITAVRGPLVQLDGVEGWLVARELRACSHCGGTKFRYLGCGPTGQGWYCLVCHVPGPQSRPGPVLDIEELRKQLKERNNAPR